MLARIATAGSVRSNNPVGAFVRLGLSEDAGRLCKEGL